MSASEEAREQEQPSVLRFRGVSKDFAGRQAVLRLDFSLAGPGVTGLVGPNGAGKTTTLRLAAGFFPPSEGTVEVGGVPLADDELGIKARIGYLPERPPLYPEMSVRSYVELVGSLKRVERGELRDRALECIEATGLSGAADRRIGALSAGFRQRVGLAASLVNDPDILLLDEPLSHLDPIQREDVLALVRREGARRSVLFSSHLLAEIEEVCERVLVLQEGRLVEEGPLHPVEGEPVEIRLKVRAEPQAVVRALEGLAPGSLRVEELPGEGPVREFHVTGAGDPATVARAIVEAGLDLMELSRARGRLASVLRRGGGPTCA